MFQLLTIYGMTFSAAGLLALGLFPELQGKLTNYLTVHVGRATEQLADMFIDLPVKRVWLMHVAAPVVGGLVLGGLFGGIWPALGGLVAGFVIPQLALQLIRWNRRRKFRGQIVDGLLVLSSSLKAGLSFFQSLMILAEEAPSPLSQEIGLVVKETQMGLALDEALKRLKKRMPMDEVTLVITTILVARETGGDVTEVFAKMIEAIRERQKVMERIKTLTMMPRLQGWVMAGIPFLFGTFSLKINPGYFDILKTDPTGNLVALAAVGLWVVSLGLIFWFSRPPA